jgi:DNA-binding ferritin-like protein
MSRKTEKKYNKDNKNNVKKRGGKYNKTKRISKINNDSKSHIVRIFIEMLNTVKLYHWKTKSFAQHKATDELYSNLNEHIDTFIEILLGKDESRIRMMEKKIDLLDSSNTTEFKMRVYEYRDFLIDMTNYLDSKKDSDLLNVRDEILGDINQFLYLMTFDK